MKIVCISDTHGLHYTLQNMPKGDVLVHAGDLTRGGRLEEMAQFKLFIEALDYPHKLVVAGNHDLCLEDERRGAAEHLLSGVTYLFDSSVVIDGLKFYGSPWQPRFFDWAFNCDRGPNIAEKWELIPEDTDVLITHGPPHGILDLAVRGVHTGCEDLLARIERVKPKLHVFGHIHEAHGKHRHEGCTFVNASICDIHYRPANQPVVIEL